MAFRCREVAAWLSHWHARCVLNAEQPKFHNALGENGMSEEKKKDKKDSPCPPLKPKEPHKKGTAPVPDNNNPDAQCEDKDES